MTNWIAVEISCSEKILEPLGADKVHPGFATIFLQKTTIFTRFVHIYVRMNLVINDWSILQRNRA